MIYQGSAVSFFQMMQHLQIKKLYHNSEVQNEYTFGVYEENNTKYFQLIYEPEIESETTPTYNLILLDHESDNTHVSQSAILSLLSDKLNGLKEVDKFDILFHDFTPQFNSDEWSPIATETILAAISKICLKCCRGKLNLYLWIRFSICSLKKR